MKNKFCNVNSISILPKWTWMNAGLGYLFPNNYNYLTRDLRLWSDKAAYLQYNKDKIIRYAHREKILVLLLAGVAVSEIGGMPERTKAYGILHYYQLKNYFGSGGITISDKTSVGSLAIQLSAAAETLGIDPAGLSTTQQLQLANCLTDDHFNIEVVARHLKDLIMFDNAGIDDTLHISDKQLIVAASRYNRGIQRKAEDIISAITAPEGHPSIEYSSCGRAIIKKKEVIYKFLGVFMSNSIFRTAVTIMMVIYSFAVIAACAIGGILKEEWYIDGKEIKNVCDVLRTVVVDDTREAFAVATLILIIPVIIHGALNKFRLISINVTLLFLYASGFGLLSSNTAIAFGFDMMLLEPSY